MFHTRNETILIKESNSGLELSIFSVAFQLGQRSQVWSPTYPVQIQFPPTLATTPPTPTQDTPPTWVFTLTYHIPTHLSLAPVWE